MKYFVIKMIHLIRFNDIPVIYNSGEMTFLIFRVEQIVVYLTSSCVIWAFFGMSGPV
jgi:hypothetical protein